MKRFFYVLLGIGIVLTLLSAYFLTIDNIYAIFSATLGILVVGFSVFEIVTQSKRGKKLPANSKNVKPIASNVRRKEDSDIEWTYYDVGETKRKEDPIEENKPVLKNTFFSNLLHKTKLKDHPRIVGKEIEKETQEESKKFIKKDDKEDKLNLLRNYIKKSLSNNIPRQKVMEACLASDWPKDKVEKVMGEFLQEHKKKHFQVLYILLPVTILLYIGLKVTDNYLLGYWVDSIKSFSIWAYWGVWFFVAAMLLIFGLDVKEKLSKKKKVYKIMKEEKVSKIKTEMKGKETTVNIASSYKTDIDKLLDLVNEKEKLSVDEVGSIFGISKEEAEEWGKILKDEGLITLYYPTVGDVELRSKKKEIVEEEE